MDKTNEKHTTRAGNLLAWYDRHRRTLPFRENPVPYHIWVSEIMLQQTRMETVLPYFNRFVRELPEIQDLAEVSEERLMKLWEGLGYYSRARNLKKAAEVIMAEHGGLLPSSFEELVKLPGIGPYTAGAIASIAFGERVPAVDGNVVRVYSRLEAYSSNVMKAEGKRFIHGAVLQDIPEGRPGDFNQAVMELGATICLPGEPLCHRCPVRSSCRAFHEGDPKAHPVIPAKKARRVEEHTVILILREGSFLLEKRPGKGLLAGLNQFPMRPGILKEEEVRQWLEELGLTPSDLSQGLWGRHVFSHVEWVMSSWIVKVQPDRVREDWIGETAVPSQPHFQWVEGRHLNDIAMPTAFRTFREELAGIFNAGDGEENRWL